MTETQIKQIPEPYKIFLQVLWAVVRTQEDGSFIKVRGVPFWMIRNAVIEKYKEYTDRQVRELAENLLEKGWIAVDDAGFYAPKGPGIEALRKMNEPKHIRTVPDLPDF